MVKIIKESINSENTTRHLEKFKTKRNSQVKIISKLIDDIRYKFSFSDELIFTAHGELGINQLGFFQMNEKYCFDLFLTEHVEIDNCYRLLDSGIPRKKTLKKIQNIIKSTIPFSNTKINTDFITIITEINALLFTTNYTVTNVVCGTEIITRDKDAVSTYGRFIIEYVNLSNGKQISMEFHANY